MDSLIISVDVTIPQVNTQLTQISRVFIFTVMVKVSEDVHDAMCTMRLPDATSPTLILPPRCHDAASVASVASSPRQPPALRGIEVSRPVASQFTQFTSKSYEIVETGRFLSILYIEHQRWSMLNNAERCPMNQTCLNVLKIIEKLAKIWASSKLFNF